MESNIDYKTELEKTKTELSMLYEISNAMRTTLKLDEILYIILTAVTSHAGLGFNRAMLFLVNERENRLEGKMGIGPDSGEEANMIWKYIENKKMTLEELINAYNQFIQLDKEGRFRLNRTVKSIKIHLIENSGILALTVLDGMPFEITNEVAKNQTKNQISELLELEDFVTVPLKAKDKVIGVIVADNRFTKESITKDDIRVLTMFANQAGLAIENSQLYEQTVVLSNSDSLTGLWNHGYFQYLLGEELKKMENIKKPLSLLMIDMDDFKIFNDSFGHQAGDSILKQVSKVLKDVSRKIDIVARYGGEEFSIILPETRKEEALILAERLRQAIENHPFPKPLTVSIGITAFPEDAQAKDELILKADKALYEAKRTGKNRTCVYRFG